MDPDLPVSVQESPVEAWVGGGLLQGWGCWVWQWVQRTFRRRPPLSSLPPPQFCLRSNNREGTQPCPSTENWNKDLLSMAHPSEQDPVFPTVSLSHQETSISLLSSSSEGGQNENYNYRKLIKLITCTTPLSNSKKLWAMLCRATQDRWVMVESSDKMWSTGEWNDKPLQYSCLEKPMNSMKRQKVMTF